MSTTNDKRKFTRDHKKVEIQLFAGWDSDSLFGFIEVLQEHASKFQSIDDSFDPIIELSSYWDNPTLTLIGWVEKTPEERKNERTAKELARLAKKQEATEQAEAEKQVLRELMEKYPEVLSDVSE